MLRKRPSFLMQKHYRDKTSIRSIAGNLRDSFDKAYEIAKSTIQAETEEAKEDFENLTEELRGFEPDEDGRPSEEALSVINRQVDRALAFHSNEEALLALEEMRIAFLFKSVEIAITQMISIAFPKLNTKDLYRWELVTTHLKANGIVIKDLPGYSETNALRIINNHIKHALGPDQEGGGNIPCWNGDSEFTGRNLVLFYNRVKPKVFEFMEDLGEAIISAAYEFDDTKLESLASDIARKLDNSQAAALIQKLKRKYPNLT